MSWIKRMRRIAWDVLRNQADVDEVMQETWLAVIPQNEGGVVSRGRLGAIVRNLAVTLLRRRVQRRDVEARRARAYVEGDVGRVAIDLAVDLEPDLHRGVATVEVVELEVVVEAEPEQPKPAPRPRPEPVQFNDWAMI